jgi:hypothetical protein
MDLMKRFPKGIHPVDCTWKNVQAVAASDPGLSAILKCHEEGVINREAALTAIVLNIALEMERTRHAAAEAIRQSDKALDEVRKTRREEKARKAKSDEEDRLASGPNDDEDLTPVQPYIGSDQNPHLRQAIRPAVTPMPRTARSR